MVLVRSSGNDRADRVYWRRCLVAVSGSTGSSAVKLRAIDGGKAPRAAKKPSIVPPMPPDEDRFIREYELSDTGNAERLATKYNDRVRFVSTWEEHIIYTDGHWKRDTAGVGVGRLAKMTLASITEDTGHATSAEKKELMKWRKKSSAAGKRRAMVELLKHEDDIALDHEDLDKDPWLLNVANGTLDLRTGELKPHDHHDLITKRIAINYNPKAKAPRWEKFLKEVLPDKDVRAFIHRFHGYCMTGDVGERMFVIFLGGGCNGKSAFLNAIESVMGSYATTAAPTLLVAKEHDSHPTEIADLYGARLAVSSETKKGATFDEERVKRLTGTDRLKARRMREDHWHFNPTHKLLIASNHKPRVKDATDSFWDRVAIVPFTVRIAKDKIDRKLGSKLKEEAEGILAWLVEGCRLWRAMGLKAPQVVMDATQEYRNDEDLVGKFLTECTAVDKNSFLFTSEIMKVNKIWAEGLNLFPVSSKELAEKLKAEPYNCVSVKRDGNMGWKGLKLTKVSKYK